MVTIKMVLTKWLCYECMNTLFVQDLLHVFNVSLHCAFRIGLLWRVIHVEFTGRNVTDAHCIVRIDIVAAEVD